MKNKWDNYAIKDGKVKSCYIREYRNRKKVRKAREASNCDSVQQSGKEQEEVKLIYKPPIHHECKVDPVILDDAWVINLRKNYESSREENPSKTHKEGRQGISGSDQGRHEAQEKYNQIQNGEEQVKKEKESPKAHKKHEAKESKAYEKKEDRKEMKAGKKK